MYLERYFEAVDTVFAQIRATQLEAIKKAAAAVSASVAQRGVFHVMDTGHMLRHEAFFRAGGIMSLVPFSYELKIDNPADQCKIKRTAEEEAELLARTITLALDSSKVTRGDIIVINSNSGRSANVIELALQCSGRGRDHHRYRVRAADDALRCGTSQRQKTV